MEISTRENREQVEVKSDRLTRLAVFVSGNGTGLQSIIEASNRGELSAKICLVVSSSESAFALKRAERNHIESYLFCPKDFSTRGKATKELLMRLKETQTDYIALAGYMKLLPKILVRAYPHHIVNIHPALLPKYGGKGMYGMNVHQAVIEAGDKVSGPTVHLVDEIYDHGCILEQSQTDVKENDTPESLAERVLAVEHQLYPKVIEKLIKGEYELGNQ